MLCVNLKISDETIQLLKNMPRYEPINIGLFGKKIKLLDGASFVSSYREIFENKIYQFNSDKADPFIIDAGANIGLSTIFFKQMYPKSKIVGFEASPTVFQVLDYNLNQFNFENVTVYQKALWKNEKSVSFFDEGADAGRLKTDSDHLNIIQVGTTRLLPFLAEDVDLLKMDIEGAETEVILDSKSKLENVKNIFIEYHSMVGEKQTIDQLLSCLIDEGFRLHIHSLN